MDDMDRPQFIALMTGAAEMFGREISPALLEMYWNGLVQYDLAAVQQALNRHINNTESGKFWPKLADFHQMLQGRTVDRASIAWSKVDKAVRQVGTWRDVVFDDPLIHVVISEMGGWILVGSKDDKEWPFVAKEFMQRYGGYTGRQERPQHQPVLTGIANAQNGVAGLQMQPAVLIGNPERCQRVRDLGSDSPRLQITNAENAIPAQLKQKQISPPPPTRK